MSELLIARRNILANQPTLKIATGNPATFVSDRNAAFASCAAAFELSQSGSGDPSPENVRPISGWDGITLYVSTTGDVADAEAYAVSWSTQGTLYGGTFDAATGVLTVTHISVDIDAISWTLDGSNSNRQLWITNGITDIKPANTTTRKPYAISSIFATVAQNATWLPYYITCPNLGYTKRIGITFEPNKYSNEGDMKTAMDGIKIVYELETPQTYQLSPVVVRALLGNNYVFSNADKNVTVQYLSC